MKILMIEPYVDIDGNIGDSTHIQELAINLSKLGCHVTLITRSSENRSFNMHNLEFKNVNLTKKPSIGLDMSKILSAMYAFLVGFKILLTSRIDVIHERQPFPIGLVLGKIFRVPTITEVNAFIIGELDSLEFNRRIKFSNSLIEKLYSIFEKVIFSSTDKIITVTSNLKMIIHEVYRIRNEKIFVLQNGVNVALFRPMSNAKEYLGLDRKYKYVCFVGNLHKPYHGIEYLIDSASFILEKIPNTKFMIIGGGVTKKKLASKVRESGLTDKFHFTGKIPYKDVPLYMNAADVCVAPFVRKRNEKIGVSPLKLYEYLACGKPVVGSNIMGIGDLLMKSNSGISVSPEDSSELARAIVKLLKDETLAKEMGENGRRFVVEEYSWERVSRKFIDLCARPPCQHEKCIS